MLAVPSLAEALRRLGVRIRGTYVAKAGQLIESQQPTRVADVAKMRKALHQLRIIAERTGMWPVNIVRVGGELLLAELLVAAPDDAAVLVIEAPDEEVEVLRLAAAAWLVRTFGDWAVTPEAERALIEACKGNQRLIQMLDLEGWCNSRAHLTASRRAEEEAVTAAREVLQLAPRVEEVVGRVDEASTSAGQEPVEARPETKQPCDYPPAARQVAERVSSLLEAPEESEARLGTDVVGLVEAAVVNVVDRFAECVEEALASAKTGKQLETWLRRCAGR